MSIAVDRQVSAALHMLRVELHGIRDFCREADSFFKKRVDEFDKDISKRKGEDEDEGYKMYLSGLRMELEERVDLTGYFGIIMVCSILEQFLHRVYEFTMNLAVRPQFDDVMPLVSRRWLSLNESKDLLKQIGVSGEPFDWASLKSLQHLRNAIVHQGGRVTEANIRFLRPLGYKEWQRITVSISDVQKNIKLVEKTTQEIGDAYLSALKKKKLIS
jgi:hypothetical protein